MKLDTKYIGEWSVKGDISILLKTVLGVLKKIKKPVALKSSCRTRNAYWKMLMNWESTAFAKNVRMPIF